MKRLKFLYMKEMLEVLRDKRTIISMIVVPVVVLPALIYFSSFIMVRAERKMQAETFSVSVHKDFWSPTLDSLLKQARLKPFSSANPKEDVASKAADVGIVYNDSAKVVLVFFDAIKKSSREAKERAARALTEYKNLILSNRLEKMNISEKTIKVFNVREINVAPPKRMGGYFIGMILGYVLVLLIFTSGMYPAVDLTAGEKERRTIELLLSTPASRGEIVTAKLLTVISVAFITSIFYLASYSVTFLFMKGYAFGSTPELSRVIELPVNVKTIVLMLAMVLPMAVFASALQLAISSFARSYKEAQSYLSPLVILIIFPALSGMLLESSENLTTYIIPVYNTIQVIKLIFLGEFHAAEYLITFVSNLIFATVAVIYAKKIYQMESVLLRE
ncbi:MAG: hypothetical protein DRQ10_07325 [Candidatus Hydrothermota bacterium]|nr:MAG: hypothetical protein DRQ10_07325 [Candidatus Hydrothermae bacterium]